MPGFNVDNTEFREKLADEWQNLVWHIGAPRPPYEKGWLFKPDIFRVLEREITHAAERLRKCRKGDPELPCLGPRRDVEIAQEELPNRQRLQPGARLVSIPSSNTGFIQHLPPRTRAGYCLPRSAE